MKLFFAIYCIAMYFKSFSQINYPTFNSRDVKTIDIVRIDKNAQKTIVYFSYMNDYADGWACANANFFLRDNTNTNKRYKLIKANNIPLCPNQYIFKNGNNKLEFNLEFEPLPNSTHIIDIIESDGERAFNFYGVNLNTSKTSTPVISSAPKIVKEDWRDCDQIIEIEKKIPDNFEDFLEGVKVAFYVPDERTEFANAAIKKYLKFMGFDYVFDDEENSMVNNICEIVQVSYKYEFDGVYFKNIKLSFANKCDRKDYNGNTILKSYSFESSNEILLNPDNMMNLEGDFRKAFVNAYGYKKRPFKSSKTSSLPKMITCWNEESLKDYYSNNKKNDKIEGIYENTNSEIKYRLALKNIDGVYCLIYLSGASSDYADNWETGEIKAKLEPTATPNLFKANWVMAMKDMNSDYYISFEQGVMNVYNSDKEKNVYLKMFPFSTNNPGSDNNLPSGIVSSGTGFAISKDGYIVTNHHVIDEAKNIKVRGISGNFTKSYNAKVIADDPNSDLAILKISDPAFTTLGIIPYTISSSTSDVGTSVYVLGFPLLASMGDEVKLTNGIISSKSGYKGDISTYQVSVPVQPGNSGGPLFDIKGNIIGIINAKHKEAENASYAIKSAYLKSLIESLNQAPKLQSVNTLSSKSLTEQVKVVKKYTYIVEIY
jgi:S1-C subfamily serine protease